MEREAGAFGKAEDAVSMRQHTGSQGRAEG